MAIAPFLGIAGRFAPSFLRAGARAVARFGRRGVQRIGPPRLAAAGRFARRGGGLAAAGGAFELGGRAFGGGSAVSGVPAVGPGGFPGVGIAHSWNPRNGIIGEAGTFVMLTDGRRFVLTKHGVWKRVRVTHNIVISSKDIRRARKLVRTSERLNKLAGFFTPRRRSSPPARPAQRTVQLIKN